MKKLMLLACFLIAGNTYASTNTVRIYNKNPSYKMLINYQVCSLSKQLKKEPTDCIPRVKTASINKGKHYINIETESWVFYIKIQNAYLLDNNDIPKAYGAFLEEECKAFQSAPVTLMEENESRESRILCVRN